VRLDDFRGASLLDRDPAAVRAARIDRRDGGGDIERNAVRLREDRDGVVPILFAASPLAAIRSAPTITASNVPFEKKCPACCR